MDRITGSCLCGKIVFDVPDFFDFIVYCHCSQCRKCSGSDYAIIGALESYSFRFIQGESYIKYYRKSAETSMAFCRSCGSHLFNRKLAQHKYYIRLGVLNRFPTQQPSFHIFVASKAPWVRITDGLPQYLKLPPVW